MGGSPRAPPPPPRGRRRGPPPPTPAEVPDSTLAGPTADTVILLQTKGGTRVVLSDVPGPTGGVTLRIAGGAVIEVSHAAITISNGQGASIVLNGATISFNGGQMTVP